MRAQVDASRRLGERADERLRTAEWGAVAGSRFVEMKQRMTEALRRGDAAEVDGETKSRFIAAVGQIDWDVVGASVRGGGSALGERIREFTEGVDWTAMKPHARKLALALVVAVATETAGELIGAHGSTLATALTGREGLLDDAASALTVVAGSDAAAMTTRFLNSEVLKSAAALASQSHLDRLGVSWA